MSRSHDKLPKLFWIQLALALIVGIGFLVTYFQGDGNHDAASASQMESAAENLEPVGVVSTKDSASTGASKARSGKEVYSASCVACHATGVANAPKLSDKAAWEPRAATGLDALLHTALNGKGAMPARGGNPAITDDEIKATVLYMTKTAGFELGEKAATEDAETTKTKEPETSQPVTATVVESTTEKVTESAPAAVELPDVIQKPVAPTAPKEPTAPNEMAVAEKVVSDDAVAAVENNKEGEKAYRNSCFACHDMGIAGSPKLGDKAAWVERIATGNDALYASAIKGKGAMPAKGGNAGLSDEAVTAAVDYMVSKSK